MVAVKIRSEELLELSVRASSQLEPDTFVLRTACACPCRVLSVPCRCSETCHRMLSKHAAQQQALAVLNNSMRTLRQGSFFRTCVHAWLVIVILPHMQRRPASVKPVRGTFECRPAMEAAADRAD